MLHSPVGSVVLSGLSAVYAYASLIRETSGSLEMNWPVEGL